MRVYRVGRLVSLLAVAAAVLSASLPAIASLSGTDVVVPTSANAPGAYGSVWLTALWVENGGASPATVQLAFLQRDVSNISPTTATVTLQPGQSQRYDDVVGTMFNLPGAVGAIRVLSTQPVLVSSRTYNDAAGQVASSQGSSLDALPASMAAGPGRTTTFLGVTPDGTGVFRYNFGVVEVDGQPVTVHAVLRDGMGVPLGVAEFPVRALEMKQYSVATLFPGVTAPNASLDLTIVAGSGRIIGFSTLIPNGSNSPTAFAMSLDTQSFVGPTGATGPTGPRGSAGPQGLVGPAGQAGSNGAPGATGPAGAQGPNGAIGPTGSAGPAGATGPAGVAGPTGAAGPTGSAGPTGAQGPAGVAGSTGATGPAGVAGPTGATGFTGPSDLWITEVRPQTPLNQGNSLVAQQISLPAGQYLILGKVSVNGQSDGSTMVYCNLTAGAIQLGASGMAIAYVGALGAEIPLMGALTVASGTTNINISCRMQVGVCYAQSVSLTALKVGTIH